MLIEEEGQRTYMGFGSRIRMRTLVTRQHRLSLYEGVDWAELYDRIADPTEMRNLWGRPGGGRGRARHARAHGARNARLVGNQPGADGAGLRETRAGVVTDPVAPSPHLRGSIGMTSCNPQ